MGHLLLFTLQLNINLVFLLLNSEIICFSVSISNEISVSNIIVTE